MCGYIKYYTGFLRLLKKLPYIHLLKGLLSHISKAEKAEIKVQTSLIKAIFSSRVLGRIWPWVLLPFTIPAISCSQLHHPTLCFCGPLTFILLFVYFCIFLPYTGTTYYIWGISYLSFLQRSYFCISSYSCTRGSGLHVFLMWDRIQPSIGGIQTTHLSCSSLGIMSTQVLTWPYTASFIFTFR